MSDPWFSPETTPADFVWLLDMKEGALHRFHKADVESDLDGIVPSCLVGGGRIRSIPKAQLVGQCDQNVFALVQCIRCLVKDIELRNSNCRENGCCPEPEWPPAPVSAPAAG